MALHDADDAPWLKQDLETGKAYTAFSIYVEMEHQGDDSQIRSLSKVALELGVSKTHISNWSRKYHWVERVAEYDAYVIGLERAEREKMIRVMARRHAKLGQVLQGKGFDKMKDVRPETLSAAQAMQALALGIKIEQEALGKPSTIIEDLGAGRVVHRVIHETRDDQDRVQKMEDEFGATE